MTDNNNNNNPNMQTAPDVAPDATTPAPLPPVVEGSDFKDNGGDIKLEEGTVTEQVEKQEGENNEVIIAGGDSTTNNLNATAGTTLTMEDYDDDDDVEFGTTQLNNSTSNVVRNDDEEGLNEAEKDGVLLASNNNQNHHENVGDGADDPKNDDYDHEVGSDGIMQPKTTTKKNKKRREINPRFKDVKETGHWGELSRREIYSAWAILTVVVLAVVIVTTVVTLNNKKNDDNNSNDEIIVPAPTQTPTLAPTPMPASEELQVVLTALNSNPVTATLVDSMPDDPNFYIGLRDGTSADATPQQLAMSWLLYEDTIKDPNQSTQRWAFASIFLQTGGGDGSWTSSEGWLSTTLSVCDWEHVSCELNGNLRELDLDSVNLVAPSIPVELTLLTDIQSILLQNNQLGGTIPADVFDITNLPRLGLLYLNNNMLSGSIPEGMTQNDGGLHTFYVQFNNITGLWPLEYCTEGLAFGEFGLDCDRVSECVCCSPLNCYYSS